jgi:hypothetical protein
MTATELAGTNIRGDALAAHCPISVNIFFMATPIWAGDLTTVTPAASRAVILSVAVPLPPEMMAPACPILLPGGAVKPADKVHYSVIQEQSLHTSLW